MIVQRRSAPSCGSTVENIPLQAERHSGRRQKLFAFPLESAFTFRPECCSESQRNGVRLQTGIAFIFDRIPHVLGGVAGLAIIAVTYGMLRGHTGHTTQTKILSLAVLPLSNLSGDPTQEYLADEMTEELCGRLARIHDLRVISRTSVMCFEGTKL